MSLLIKGVQVVDGTGKDPYKADVLIQGGLISSVGEIRGRKADQVLEGFGNYLTPGFIDVHARSDASLSLFENPEQEGFLKQGVVNIIGGHHGFSLAPTVYGDIESIRHWSDGSGFNVNWHGVKEFLGEIRRFNLGINFGTFAGYSGVRIDITNGRKSLEKKEAEVIHKILKDAMKEGAFGISFDFARWGVKELKDIAKLVAQFRGVVVVKLGVNPKDYVKTVAELISVAKSTKVKMIIEGLYPIKGAAKEFKEAINLIDAALDQKVEVKFLVQPLPISQVHIKEYLPQALRYLNFEEALKKLKEPKYKAATKRMWQNLDFRNVRVVSAPKHHFLAGKNIVDLASNWDISYIDAMFKLMQISELHASIERDNLSTSLLRGALAEEAALITANLDGARSGGGVLINELVHGAIPQYFRTVMGEGLLSIEDAVAKVTSVPTRFLNIHNRGMIEEGAPADLVLLGKDDYAIKKIFLEGKAFQEESLEGQVLRHSKY